jgi:RNA polymerase sigma-70 factor (ECF subfamily)
MMFAICHPRISIESQVSLSLRVLCGFGIDEIADAFLTNKETINKRIYRAKEKLSQEKVQICMPSIEEMEIRLGQVLLTIYLLFNEGYYSESNEQTIRKDLCLEAIRLCKMLTDNKDTARPEVFALLALMCFHSSRFEARINRDGSLILYDDQDELLWDQELIKMGVYYLNCSASGDQLTKYHLEANIAYWNTKKEDSKEKWENILKLYNLLLQIEYSPVAALNRTYALSKVNGKQEAIIEAEKLQLTSYHFYYALLAELYTDIDNIKAQENFAKSISIAKTEKDRQVLKRKLADLLSTPIRY